MFRKIAIAIVILVFMFLVVVGIILLFTGHAFAANYIKDGLMYKDFHVVTKSERNYMALNNALEEITSLKL